MSEHTLTHTLEEGVRVVYETLAVFVQSASETHWGSSESIQMQNTRTHTHFAAHNTHTHTHTVLVPAHTLNSLAHTYDSHGVSQRGE